MLARSVLNLILNDEALTRHLGDAEARVLIEWLVDTAESLGLKKSGSPGEATVAEEVRRLCRRGRAVARFVCLWALKGERGAAAQLAAAERFRWPLPDGPIDPCLLMQRIVGWELKRSAA